MSRTSRPLRLAVLAFAALPALLAAAQGLPKQDGGLSKRDGERFERKLVEIVRQSESRARARLETRVSEDEVNAYFAHQGRDLLPAGVVSPRVAILGDGRLAGHAVVDLDVIRDARASGGWLDPASYLAGKLPVVATGLLRTREGVAWIDVQAVQVAGVTVPRQLLQQLVTYYSRTAETPEGIILDDPIPLPAGIREIVVRRGEALIVQ